MPSFLSKLLGRKKTQEPDSFADKRGQPSSLLEGKFEAVSPNVSPSAAHFTDLSAAQIKGTDKPKDKDTPFHLFRTKSRPSSDSPTVEKAVPDVPHLSLNLPITKDRGQALDVVFESDPEAFALLNEAAIGERRLTPHETLSLVRACSQAIIEHGLETLGVMHPHWHSASPEVQHRLISLYLLSLASKSPTTTTLPTSPDSPAAFESELHYTCSPYDVAAVLRWGLRHLKLDGTSFGKGSGDWTWYNTFAEAERTNSYPLDAFSKSLIPQLPAIHSELLLAILDIISSLSARCEANGSSGSKLSKLFGLWLLTVEHSPEGDDWNAFYDRWDRAGRILEHLFLARIRDDAHRMPRRLTELVEHYPYPRGVEVLEDNLWPRSRFSTRDYDALFVRLDTEYTGVLKPRSHPLRLIADALRSQSATESATSEDSDLWETIKKASLASDTLESTSDTAPTEPIPVFSNVFSDETIRLFSLIPVDASNKDKTTPTFALHSPISPGRPRSFSLPESPRSPFQVEQGRASTFVHTHVVPSPIANTSTAPTTASPETPTDWLQFSSQGFGTTPGTRDLVATLWDNDVEVTTPPSMSLSRKSSRRAHSRRSSVDSPSAQTPVLPLPAVSAPLTSKTTLIAKVKVDEAFIDFWADALLDPISKPWPRFVLCQLKPLPFAVASTTPALTWLVIEQRFVRPASAPPSKEEVEGPTAQPRLRASSPRPSSRVESSRLSAAFSLASKKRFGFFTGGSGDPKSPKELFSRLPQVGEFGEGMNETGRGAVAAAAEGSETEVKDGVKDRTGQDIAPAPTAIDAVAVATNDVAAVIAAANQEEIIPALTKDSLPAVARETVLLEPAGVPTLEGDKALKGQSNATDPPQNGLAHNGHHHDGGCKAEPKTTAHVPLDANGAMLPPALDEPVTTEAGLPAQEPGAEAGITRPTTEPSVTAPYFTGIGEGLVPQAVAAPSILPTPVIVTIPAPEEVVALLEPAPVSAVSSAPEPYAMSVVGGGIDNEKAATPVASKPAVDSKYIESDVREVVVKPATETAMAASPATVEITADAANPPPQDSPTVGEPKFSNAPASESVPTPAPISVPAEESAAPALEVTVTTQVAEAEPVAPAITTAATSPEGQAVPAELAPVSTHVSTSEQPACKDHPAAVTKGRAATLDGTAPTDVKDSTGIEAIPTVSGAAPAILLLRVNDGKAAAPTGVVETIATPSQSRPIAIVEKETQVTATTAVPDGHGISKLSGVNEPATEFFPVEEKAAVPPPESFDYPAVAQSVLAVSAPSVEPGHATPTALPAGRGHPLRVTLEEQYTTTGPDLGVKGVLAADVEAPTSVSKVPQAPADISTRTGEPATLNESDVASTQLDVNKNIPLAGRVHTSGSSVAESQVDDSEHSRTNGSVQPAVAHAKPETAGGPDATVTVPIDGLTAGQPAVAEPALTAQTNTAIRWLGTRSEHDEELVAIGEGHALPTAAEMPVESPVAVLPPAATGMPAHVTQEPSPTTKETPIVSETPMQAPTPAPQGLTPPRAVTPVATVEILTTPVHDEHPAAPTPEVTVSITADTPVKASALATKESAYPVSQPGASVSTKTPTESSVPIQPVPVNEVKTPVQPPTPVPEESSIISGNAPLAEIPVTAAATVTVSPASVSKEPVSTLHVAPAAATPAESVAEASASVIEITPAAGTTTRAPGQALPEESIPASKPTPAAAISTPATEATPAAGTAAEFPSTLLEEPNPVLEAARAAIETPIEAPAPAVVKLLVAEEAPTSNETPTGTRTSPPEEPPTVLEKDALSGAKTPANPFASVREEPAPVPENGLPTESAETSTSVIEVLPASPTAETPALMPEDSSSPIKELTPAASLREFATENTQEPAAPAAEDTPAATNRYSLGEVKTVVVQSPLAMTVHETAPHSGDVAASQQESVAQVPGSVPSAEPAATSGPEVPVDALASNGNAASHHADAAY